MLRSISSRLAAAALLLAAVGHAQQQQTLPANDDGSYTLHVYTNRIQIPTLVLDQHDWLVPRLKASDFQIHLDEGRAFAPTLARIEGNDPIALALVLDASGDQQDIDNRLAATLAAIPADIGFASHDRVSVYAVHCSIHRAINFAPASKDDVVSAVTTLLSDPTIHDRSQFPACNKGAPLYDALIAAGKDLMQLPGRRVVLAVADSFNAFPLHASRNDVALLYKARSISFFSIKLCPCITRSRPLGYHSDEVDPLEQLSIDTGGKLWSIGADDLRHTLAAFLQDIRGRYILEFPRPDNFDSGQHTIRVTVRHLSDGIIRPSGTTATPIDASTLNDPTTVATPAPAVLGNRRPMTGVR